MQLFREVLENVCKEFRTLVTDNHFGYTVDSNIIFKNCKDRYITSITESITASEFGESIYDSRDLVIVDAVNIDMEYF